MDSVTKHFPEHSWGEPERAPHRRVARSQSIYICIMIYGIWYMVRPSPARRYIQCTATRDIFRRPHEETSALSGTTCIIIAESAKQIHSVCPSMVCLSVRTCPRKAKYSDRDLGHAPALPGMY